MGRDLLAQDYLLKQIMASLTYPEEGLGREFWDRVYAQTYKEYGTTDVPVDTFHKVWILPEKAQIYEKEGTAFIVESRLRVMLEDDYLALNKAKGMHRDDLASRIAKDVLLPELEREVNEGKNFALLRQVYHSMILATWYKRWLKESLLGQIYVNKEKVKGVDVTDKEITQKIYSQYIESLKKGAYAYIKEEYDERTHKVIPRKYFSGGVEFGEGLDRAMTTTSEVSPSLMEKLKKFISVSMITVMLTQFDGDRPVDDRYSKSFNPPQATTQISQAAGLNLIQKYNALTENDFYQIKTEQNVRNLQSFIEQSNRILC